MKQPDTGRMLVSMAATLMESSRALDERVRAVAEARDEAGVLSITIGLEPGASARGSTPGWEIALRNALDDVRADAASSPLLDRRLEQAQDRLEQALDPTSSGRGCALFVFLASGETVELTVRPALPTTARVGPCAHVLPFLALLDEGTPAGLVQVSRDRVSVHESELGVVHDVERIDVEPWVGDWWPEMKGPARANPLRGQQSVSQRDRYARRVAEAYRHTLHEATTTVASLARRRSWTRAALAGDPPTTRPLEEALADSGVATTVVGANLEGLREDEAIARLEAALAQLVVRQAWELVRRVEDESAGRRAGAWGAETVVAALNEGRVATLVVDAATAVPGRVGPDELLEASSNGTDGTVDLIDPIVSRALATGASVRAVSGEAAEALEPAGGIGALLRW